MPEQTTRVNVAVYVALAYMAWFITTPQFSPRFSFLGEIHFEKFLAGGFIVVAALTGNLAKLLRPIPVILGVLFGWMVLSCQMSEFKNLGSALHWQDVYWKQIAFFACLTISLRTERQFRIVIHGVAGIILFYQLYSWLDFINGGSYVYQQGMKRMKGTWGEGGYGAGNAWGFLGLFGVPISVACYRLATTALQRYLSIVLFISTNLCIVFSGTRGAMLAAAIYIIVVFRKQLLKFRYVVAVIGLLFLAVPLLPDDIKNRVLTLVTKPDEGNATQADKTASDSANGRLQGLIDGFQLANESPIFGCGPAVSAQAAFEMRERNGTTKENEEVMQLHNLYGQVPGELGYVGLAIWLVLLLACFLGAHRARREAKANAQGILNPQVAMGDLILGLLGVLLIYGCAGHSLYDYRWLFIFGMANSLSAMMADRT